MRKELHSDNPRLLLLSGVGMRSHLGFVENFFLDFCLKKKPLPYLVGKTVRESFDLIRDFFKKNFTEDKDLVIRAGSQSMIDGIVLFDRSCGSLEGARPENCVELVIAASSSNNWAKDRDDFETILNLYQKERGHFTVALNVNREHKRKSFERFVTKTLKFEKTEENLYLRCLKPPTEIKKT